MQTDLGDTRLVNYFLEHGYQWMKSGMHESFWNPLFYYPHLNVAAYAEVLIGVGPFYWFWRWLGFSMDTSFQFWMMTMSTLDYVLCAFFLIHILNVGKISAFMGAFLFAFGAARVSALCHQQLLPAFYIIFSLWGLCRLFVVPKRNNVNWYFFMFFSGIVLQCYSGFYLAWFYVFSLVIAIVWVFFKNEYRKLFFSFLKENRFHIIFYSFFSMVALYPFLVHYGRTHIEIGDRSFSEVKSMLTGIRQWFYHGPDSWLYGWLSQLVFFRDFPMEHEKRMGVGFLTMILFCLGLSEHRKHPLVHLSILVAVTWFICTTSLPYRKSLWGILYPVVPGAGAIRAISRLGIFFLIIEAIGIALWFDKKLKGASQRRVGLKVVVLFLFCVLEQGTSTLSYNKIYDRDRVAYLEKVVLQAKNETSCEAFYYSPIQGAKPNYVYQLDAMLVALRIKFPTLNGYTGSEPPGWFLSTNVIQSKETEAQLTQAIKDWASREKFNPDKICWIKIPDSFIGT